MEILICFYRRTRQNFLCEGSLRDWSIGRAPASSQQGSWVWMAGWLDSDPHRHALACCCARLWSFSTPDSRSPPAPLWFVDLGSIQARQTLAFITFLEGYIQSTGHQPQLRGRVVMPCDIVSLIILIYYSIPEFSKAVTVVIFPCWLTRSNPF